MKQTAYYTFLNPLENWKLNIYDLIYELLCCIKISLQASKIDLKHYIYAWKKT